MSILLAVEGAKIKLEPKADWAWQSFEGEITLKGSHSLLSVDKKLVLIKTDFPQTHKLGKKTYTTLTHSTPGIIEFVALSLDDKTLSTQVFSEAACLTEKTSGTFQALVTQPALTPNGVADLIVSKSGQWAFVEAGQEMMAVEETEPQSVFLEMPKKEQVPTEVVLSQEKLEVNGEEKSTTTQTATKQEGIKPKIEYARNADKTVVSEYTKQVLRDALIKSGNKRAIISSTARDPYNQARVMYNNLEKKDGVLSQKELYGRFGDQVIDVYVSSKKAGKNREQIIKDMKSKIEALGPQKVSNHAADSKVLGVIDVAPSSITHKEDFLKAIDADKRVSNIIQPPKDPAYHIEIPQPLQQP
ncbi:MAG: hypothetical protein VSS75_005385 [Candidatus Parabeggiatoa sp.]|nr:hypothetical protein [Candidatus Parabeggiatoa sp.]